MPMPRHLFCFDCWFFLVMTTLGNDIADGGRNVHTDYALAFGCTIAGKHTILGAASNVIIIQQADTRGDTGVLGVCEDRGATYFDMGGDLSGVF